MSRWARPASQSDRISAMPLAITVSSTGASSISTALVDEARDQQVFAFGCDLGEPVRLGGRDVAVAKVSEHVVLVLHHPADGVERAFVLERSVDHRTTELVPAVGAEMALRVQLPEEPTPVGEFDLERRRAARTGEPERFLVRDLEPQLFAERDIDRGAAVPTDVQVRGPSRSIGHREDCFGSEDTEAQEGDRESDDESDPISDGVDVRVRIEPTARTAHKATRSREPVDAGRPAGTSPYTRPMTVTAREAARVGRMPRDARLSDARGREPSDDSPSPAPPIPRRQRGAASACMRSTPRRSPTGSRSGARGRRCLRGTCPSSKAGRC